MFLKKIVPRERGLDQPGPGVTDIGSGDTFAAEELFFKGKDAQEKPDGTADGFDSSFAPRPTLRSDKIHDRNTLSSEPSGGAEVKIGGIGKNGEIRGSGAGGGH